MNKINEVIHMIKVVIKRLTLNNDKSRLDPEMFSTSLA